MRSWSVAARTALLALLLSSALSSVTAASLKYAKQPDGVAAGDRVVRSAEEGSDGETAVEENHLGEGEPAGNATAEDNNAEEDELSNATHVHRPHRGPHVHGRDGKAGCYGYRYPVFVVYATTTTTESSDVESQRLRSRMPARSRRRGRRGAPEPRPERTGTVAAGMPRPVAALDETALTSQPQGGQLASLVRKAVNDIDFNDLDHAKLEALLEDDGTARVRREAPAEADDVEVEEVEPKKTSILDYSIRDLVKRCVDSIVGAAGGGNGAGVAIAKEGFSLGRTAINGGVAVARMIVQAFRELGTSSSLVGDVVESPQPDLDGVVLGEADAAANSRSRRDAITNIRKNLKSKSEVVMSRVNDVGDNVNERMDNVFGESKVYQKAKEMVMTILGKVVQTAASAGAGRRRRDTAEATPRPRKGKAAILARVLADLDNMPGRRVAKLVASKREEEVQDAGDDQHAGPEDAGGEAADMLRGTRSRRSAWPKPLTAFSTAAPTEAPSEEEEEDETTEGVSDEDRPAASTEAPRRDIGEELGVRVRRDVAEDVRNMTDRIVQKGKEMVAKVKQVIEEAVRKMQGGAARPPAPAAGASAGAAEGKDGAPADAKPPMPPMPPPPTPPGAEEPPEGVGAADASMEGDGADEKP